MNGGLKNYESATKIAESVVMKYKNMLKSNK